MAEAGAGRAAEPTAMQRAATAIRELSAQIEAMKRARHEPIAVVGLACRFPGGANDPASYWRLLAAGGNGVGEVPRDRWDADLYYDPDPDAPGKTYTKHGGFLDRPPDRFDARFFEISAREAVAMDPQQRLLLELAWEGIEDAGLAPAKLAGTRTGVFVGIAAMEYAMLGRQSGAAAAIDAYSATGNAFSVASGRIAHVLGLTGPNLALDTACSSSLVAVALAVRSLREGHADYALAGGVHLLLGPDSFVAMSKLRALAPDGRCKTFAAGADGYVRGEGGGVVVLRRLADALADGDRIHAVIRGAAVNHDGRSSGLTVPNAAAQRAVIRAALEDAGLVAGDVDYVEAHGTGTDLGDPIEVRALNAVLGRGRSRDRALALGSVKTNFGHLEAAAGIAGLIKLVLSLSHEAIPPHLHLDHLTPHVDWDELPLTVPTRLTTWPRDDRPRVGGVSAFGFSGTNAHVLVEEAPTRERPVPTVAGDRTAHLLCLSARSPAALRDLAGRYRTRLDDTTGSLADLCFTAATGRGHFEHRLAVAGSSADAMAAGLEGFLRGDPDAPRAAHAARTRPRKVAFLFTGHGAQYIGMGRQLFDSQPVFRAAMEECDALLRPALDRSLLSVLYPSDADADADARAEAGDAERLLNDGMTWSQPALFAVEYALARLWRSWGIEPAAVLGHSVGEYAAAVVAGVLDLADGARLVAARGRLMDALPERGAMAAVFAAEADVAELMAPWAGDVALAAINTPAEVVISGPRPSLEQAVARLAGQGIEVRWLQVAQAGHSSLLDPMLDAFQDVASEVRFAAPRLRLVSCTTADVVSAAEVGDPAYWRRHLREPVRFAAAIERLHAEGCDVFLEAGPHPTLLAKGEQCLPGTDTLWLSSLRRGEEDWPQLLASLAALYGAGVTPDFDAFDRGYGRTRVALPTYPFQGERYWLPGAPPEPGAAGEPAGPDLDGIEDWLYQTRWVPAPRAGTAEPARAGPGHWLVLADRGGTGAALAARLEDEGHTCRLVFAGGASGGSAAAAGDATPGGSAASSGYVVDAADPVALRELVEAAAAGDRPLRGVLHLWSLDIGGAAEAAGDAAAAGRWLVAGLDRLARAEALGPAALLPVLQALAAREVRSAAPLPRLWAFTRGAQAVLAEATTAAGVAQVPLWGVGRTAALEHPGVWGGMVDLDPDAEPDVARLADELVAPDGEVEVAFRRGARHAVRVVPAPPGLVPNHSFRPRPDGAYLITGGLGGLGLEVARWLARRGARRLILLGRQPLPPRAEWKRIREPALAARIQAVRDLEALGAAVHLAPIDVADPDALAAFIAGYDDEGWPPIRGVVHAAGVARDATLAQMDAAALHAVLRPKVYGGWLLHTLLRDRPLDFFVLFSSAAALIGSPGLANYVAANTFLDGLAIHRRRHGLTALSVGWGAWQGVGLAARSEVEARRERSGIGAIEPARGTELLGRLLRQDAPQVGVIPLPPAELRAFFPAGAPWFAELSAAAPPDTDREQAMRDRILETDPEERPRLLLAHLQRRIGRITRADPAEVSADLSVMQLGMDSLMIMELIRELNLDLGLTLYPREVFERPSVHDLAQYLCAELEVARRVLPTREPDDATDPAQAAGPERARGPEPASGPEPAGEAGYAMDPAFAGSRDHDPGPDPESGPVFLVSSPRSGSTLLRVMLAGHPRLFSPPELHLLPFDTLGQWAAGLEGTYVAEGLQRALMELMGLDAGGSAAVLAEWVAQDLPIPEVYHRLQALAGGRTLVDKSPSYAGRPGILERAERIFGSPRYVHLVRHPHAAVESFVRTRMDRMFGGTGDPLTAAEQVWSSTNRNALEFLAGVDPDRHLRVRYEDLVTRPEAVMRRLCDFLELPFVPELLSPYDGDRMRDGVHAQSIVIGDANFMRHHAIDASLADAWKAIRLPRPLSAAVHHVAAELDYPLPTPSAAPDGSTTPAASPATPAATPGTPAATPATPAAPPIRPAPRDGVLPLSFAQQRLFFLYQLEPESPTYNVPGVLRLTGPLDTEALGRSLLDIVRRHEVLRTRVLVRDGQPVQEVAPPGDVPLPIDDLSAVPPDERDTAVRQAIRAETRRPLDLARDTKLRARLLRIGDTEHVLVLTMHHIASDGSSLGILLRELAALYDAHAAGRPAELPGLPVQYADYAHWQRRLLEGDALDEQIAYWKRQLADLPTLELPTRGPRPPLGSHRGATETLAVPDRLARDLTRVSRDHDVTLFMTLLAAFQLLLGRLAGQEDVVVGTPIAGRHQAGTEGLIGFFLNNLALRTDLSGNPSFGELLARVRRTTLDAYAHQDVPFERLIEELKPARDMSRTPLFQVLFNMPPRPPAQELRLGGARAELVVDLERDAKFDFTLYVTESPELRLHLIYNVDLFDAAAMRELLRQYERLLAQVVAEPGGPIVGYDLRTATAAGVLPDPTLALVPAWPGSVPARVAARAAREPDRVALRTEAGPWTYGELDAASRGLAHRLRAGGVAAGDIVAVYGDRGAALAVALLGVLRAGAAFLVLDPAHPPARIEACLAVARPRAWLTLEPDESAGAHEAEAGAATGFARDAAARADGGPSAASVLPFQLALPPTKPRLLDLLSAPAADAPEPDPGSGPEPWSEPGPDDLAYVAFTSGTTGEPKAILGTHGPLSHFLDWYDRTWGLTPADRFSVLSGLGHDPLLRDLFAPLWVGAAACIPSPVTREEPRALLEWLRNEEITVAHLTPAMGEALATGAETAEGRALLPALRLAVFGGDALAGRHVAGLRRLSPGARCVNGYGATETPQLMAAHEVAGEAEEAGAVVPLGQGIDGVQLLVLRDGGRPCGIGELGEICVRTPYLARGYLDDPALTAARFSPNPFGSDPHDRLYRTGDAGRYGPDGSVRFAGRLDGQLKVRGYRVEPAEIEAALAGHPLVATAAVVLTGDRLVAFVVPSEEGLIPDSYVLRGHLGRTLPPYMVPSRFVPVSAIPLLRNGKVDRRTLLALEDGTARRQRPVTPPASPAEQAIAGIWGELLGVDAVGADDSFYDLGGHSLLALQAVSRIEQVTGTRINPRELNFQTVRQLALLCENGGENGGTNGDPGATGLGRRFLSRLMRATS